jgi:hypothetical protein
LKHFFESEKKQIKKKETKMRSNTQQQRPVTQAEEMGLGPKKTALVLFTVVGCIAILSPKIFYPMLVGAPNDNRGPPSELFEIQQKIKITKN